MYEGDRDELALCDRVEALEAAMRQVATAIDATHPEMASAIRADLEGE
jgi:hypothetical protein